jgi:preprotein translocase subunit SecY
MKYLSVIALVLSLISIIIIIIITFIQDKGKEIPLQAWTGHEGSRRSRLPDFKTFGT